MPGLDYKNAVPPSIHGASLRDVFGRGGKAIYGPGNTVKCPDCGKPAVIELGGDHGGQCLTDKPEPKMSKGTTSALSIIRRAALTNGHVDANLVRSDMDAAGVPGPSRGPAFAMAVRRGYLEPDGYAPSTDAATKAHPIAQYRSLLWKEPA